MGLINELNTVSALKLAPNTPMTLGPLKTGVAMVKTLFVNEFKGSEG